MRTVGSTEVVADLASILAFFAPVGGDKSKASEVAGLFLVASKAAGGLKALLPDVGGKKLPLRAKFNNACVEKTRGYKNSIGVNDFMGYDNSNGFIKSSMGHHMMNSLQGK